MSTEENKAVVRRLIEALNEHVWPTGDFTAADALIAPQYVYHDPVNPITGREGFHQLIATYSLSPPTAGPSRTPGSRLRSRSPKATGC